MEYYYKGKKTTTDLTELFADLLEEQEYTVIDKNMDVIIEMCEKKEFPYRYLTDN